MNSPTRREFFKSLGAAALISIHKQPTASCEIGYFGPPCGPIVKWNPLTPRPTLGKRTSIEQAYTLGYLKKGE